MILTVRTAETPRVPESERVKIYAINDDFRKVIVNYGFMETPNVPKALGVCRKQGLKFDIMSTSFFLGRRSVVPSAQSGMPPVAGQHLHLPAPQRRQPDRFLPHPARPGGGDGRAGHRLRRGAARARLTPRPPVP